MVSWFQWGNKSPVLVCPRPVGMVPTQGRSPSLPCDPFLTECCLDLFQSSLKRRGSRETYKEKKTLNQVSRGFVLMLHLLRRQSHPMLNFLFKMLASPLRYSKKHYLAINVDSFKTFMGEAFLSKPTAPPFLCLAPISWWFLQEREQNGFVWDVSWCRSGLWQYP